MEPYIGQIMLFAGEFAPKGWAFCDGQLLSVTEHSALYSILGVRYGGDGRTTFALPDLRGRAPIHRGKGGGLTDRPLGDRGGVESVALTLDQMPKHGHQMGASSSPGVSTEPTNRVLAEVQTAKNDHAVNAYAPHGNTQLKADAIKTAGADAPHTNMQPYLALNYVIALAGQYAPRD